jgi:hypothetical protein
MVTTKGTHRVSAEERPTPPDVGRLVHWRHDAEEDLQGEIKNQQRQWHYRVRRGRVWFDKELREAHRRLRQSIPAYILEGNILSLLTAPVIYSIKHARAVPAPHQRYHVFLDYGDATGYRKELSALRQAMKARPRHGSSTRRPQHE